MRSPLCRLFDAAPRDITEAGYPHPSRLLGVAVRRHREIGPGGTRLAHALDRVAAEPAAERGFNPFHLVCPPLRWSCGLVVLRPHVRPFHRTGLWTRVVPCSWGRPADPAGRCRNCRNCRNPVTHPIPAIPAISASLS